MVGAVGRVQQSLGARAHLAAVQQQVADPTAEFGAAGLAGAPVDDTRLQQQRAQTVDLSGLADAVAAFEGDEQTGVMLAALTAR